MDDDTAGLVERLTRTEKVNDPFTLKPRLINPDGSEAAATLTAQAAEIARLKAFVFKVEAFFLHRIQSENCFHSSMTSNEINLARANNQVSESWIAAARALTGSHSHD